MKPWLAISLSLTAAACGGIARTTGSDVCSTGQQIECDCLGHTKGIRTCSSDSLGYDACVCDPGMGGGDDDAGGPAPASCTSKSAWMDGLQGSDAMTPGRPCIACHQMTPKAPQYTLAGTIYSGSHEADDCNGVDGLGVAVAFFNDSGSELGARIQVNRVGNFFVSRSMPAQYHVKIISGGKESVMQAPLTHGDCNLCHTASGAQGANGRLVKP